MSAGVKVSGGVINGVDGSDRIDDRSGGGDDEIGLLEDDPQPRRPV